MANLPTQYSSRNASGITAHSEALSDTLLTDAVIQHQPEESNGGKLEQGGFDNSASPGVGTRLKRILPTSVGEWSRRRNFTWKHYTIFALILLLPVIIIALSLGLTLGRKHGAPTHHSYPPIDVDLGYTQYEGSILPSGINQWLGMRYAAPPLGELRFKAPQDPPNSSKQTALKVCLVTYFFSHHH
jgi:hypothetical protein